MSDRVKATLVSPDAVSAMFTWEGGLVWEKEPGVRLGEEYIAYLAPRCLYRDPDPVTGSVRYRLGAVPMLHILAAFGVVAVWDSLRMTAADRGTAISE